MQPVLHPTTRGVVFASNLRSQVRGAAVRTYVQDGVVHAELRFLLQAGQGLRVLVAQVSVQSKPGTEPGAVIQSSEHERVTPALITPTVVNCHHTEGCWHRGALLTNGSDAASLTVRSSRSEARQSHPVDEHLPLLHSRVHKQSPLTFGAHLKKPAPQKSILHNALCLIKGGPCHRHRTRHPCQESHTQPSNERIQLYFSGTFLCGKVCLASKCN